MKSMISFWFILLLSLLGLFTSFSEPVNETEPAAEWEWLIDEEIYLELEEDELYLIGGFDGTFAVDRNLEVTVLPGWLPISNLGGDIIGPQLISRDDLVILSVDANNTGLYDLAKGEWSIEPVYDDMYVIVKGAYYDVSLYDSLNSKFNWFVADEQGNILSDNEYYSAIRESDSFVQVQNEVYKEDGLFVGMAEDTVEGASLQGYWTKDENGYYVMKNWDGELTGQWAECQLVSVHYYRDETEYFELCSEDGNVYLADMAGEILMDMEEFMRRNPEVDSSWEQIYLYAIRPETNQLLMGCAKEAKGDIQDPQTYQEYKNVEYLCDLEWNVIRDFEEYCDVESEFALRMTDGGFIQEDFWNGEEIMIPSAADDVNALLTFGSDFYLADSGSNGIINGILVADGDTTKCSAGSTRFREYIRLEAGVKFYCSCEFFGEREYTDGSHDAFWLSDSKRIIHPPEDAYVEYFDNNIMIYWLDGTLYAAGYDGNVYCRMRHP